MDTNFNSILKSFRIEKSITQKKLCNGLCSISMLSHIEKGDRIPDYALHMRLYKRLGLGSGRLIHFLSPSEYELWSLKKELIRKICFEESMDNSALLDRLSDAIPSGDVISLQFIHDLKGQKFIQEKNYKDAFAEYEKAISLTMEGINEDNLSEYAIAPLEYYYLLMRIKCQSHLSSAGDRKISHAYRKILANIEGSTMDLSTLAEIFPLAVMEYINFQMKDEDFNPASVLSLIERTINLLQESSRTYFLSELMEISIQIYKSSPQKSALLEKAETILSAQNIICSAAGIENTRTLSPFYFYADENCQNISDVIKERRVLMKITQDKLSDGICSAKTLRRIEQGAVIGHNFNLSLLLERMNIFDCNQYDDCISDDWNILSLSHKLRSALHNNDSYLQKEIFYELRDSIDNNHLMNKQTLSRSYAMIQLNDGTITAKECIDKLIESLSLTIPFDIVKAYKKGYLTEGEIECIYAIATIADIHNIDLKWMNNLLENIVTNADSIRPSFKAVILRFIGNNYANARDYKNSDKYTKMALKTELDSHKIQVAYIALYDLAWNEAKSGPHLFAPSVLEKLRACLTFAEFFNNEPHMAFFSSRIKLFENKDIAWLE